MTKAKFYKDKEGHIIKYTLSGHAGFSDHGRDIVCAAVSVLAQTGLMSLSQVCSIDIDYSIDDGFLEVVLPSNLTVEQRKKADVVLETILLGIQSSKESYPEYITLEYGEV